MKKYVVKLVMLVLALTVAVSSVAYAAVGFEEAYRTTGDYIAGLGVPYPGSIGGEWMVIGLARSGREVTEGYLANAEAFVLENINENGQLHRAKSTENSRMILGLTAAGVDVTDVANRNLLDGLSDLNFIGKQGINGPIWALIALDSGNYELPADSNYTRELLVQVVLMAQLFDGGWTIAGDKADSDMTGMALQALAPYYVRDGEEAAFAVDVNPAVDAALAKLSEMQNDDGSYGTNDGNGNIVSTSESISQVIVALTALGIDPEGDERFIKDGNSAVDALLEYYVEGGGFKHLMDGNLDGMATEQAYYALTAYSRFLNGQTRLYDMTDTIK